MSIFKRSVFIGYIMSLVITAFGGGFLLLIGNTTFSIEEIMLHSLVSLFTIIALKE